MPKRVDFYSNSKKGLNKSQKRCLNTCEMINR